MPPVKIVVDSTADLPPEVTTELGITVVPCLLRFGNRSFREGVDISRAEFFARMKTDPHFPSTAAPAPGVFEDIYRRLAAETEAIISIHISARYSGIFNAARLGAEAAEENRQKSPLPFADPLSPFFLQAFPLTLLLVSHLLARSAFR